MSISGNYESNTCGTVRDTLLGDAALVLPKSLSTDDMLAVIESVRGIVAAERERCAAICDRLAKYIEDGQVPRSADRRLRQAARYIREPRHV